MDNAAFQAARLAAARGIDPPQLARFAHPIGDLNTEDAISKARFTTRELRPYAAYVEGKLAEHAGELEDLQPENENGNLHDLLEELQEDPVATGNDQYGEVPSHQHIRPHRRVIRPRFVHKAIEIHEQILDEQEGGPNESDEKKEGGERKQTDAQDGKDGTHNSSESVSGEQASETEQIHMYPEADSVLELDQPSEEQRQASGEPQDNPDQKEH